MATNEEILGIYFGILILLPIVVGLLWSLCNLTIVKQKEVMIVERWGKYHAKVGRATYLSFHSSFSSRQKWGAGLHWLFPIMDKPRKIIWRELEVEQQSFLLRTILTVVLVSVIEHGENYTTETITGRYAAKGNGFLSSEYYYTGQC